MLANTLAVACDRIPHRTTFPGTSPSFFFAASSDRTVSLLRRLPLPQMIACTHACCCLLAVMFASLSQKSSSKGGANHGTSFV